MHTHLPRGAAALAVGTAAILLLGACSAPTLVAAKPTPRPTDSQVTDVVPTETPTSEPIPDPTDDTAGYTWVFDDTKHVAVSVPVTWTEVDGSGYVADDGTNYFTVSASPNLHDYWYGWTTPGVDVGATPFPEGGLTAEEADAADKQHFASMNEAFNFDASCDPDQVNVPYGDTDGWYKGYLSTWNDCHGTKTSVLLMHMYDTKLTHFIYITSLLTTPQEQDEVAQEILASYQAKFDDKAYVPRD